MSRSLNIVTADNGVGLSTDIRLLTTLCRDAGWDTEFVKWDGVDCRRADVAIHIELVAPRMIRRARRNIFVPHWEWFNRGWRSYLERFTEVWAKTRESEAIATAMRCPPVFYTGWLGQDRMDDSVARKRDCLHLRGKSGYKGTATVLESWRSHSGQLPHLWVVSSTPLGGVARNVTVLPRIEEAELVQLMNTCSIHVCPSETEGFAHHIAEGLSVDAHIVTTDGSPMNEHVRPEFGTLLPTATRTMAYVTTHHCDSTRLADAVMRAAHLAPNGRAREHFEARNKAAAAAILERLGPA